MTSDEIKTIEIPLQDGARLIDDCTHLFATEVRELEELTLGLAIVEAKLQAPIASADANDPLGFLRIGACPIQEDKSCGVFKVVFDRKHLISYTVLHESYGKYPTPPEAFTGKLFRVFSQSHLLDFTERTTYASAGHPAPLMHFEITCLNHVIDVICTARPTILLGKQA